MNALAEDADRLEAEGELGEALARWREAYDLLPPGTVESDSVRQKIVELGPRAEKGAWSKGPKPGSRASKIVGSLGFVGLFLWKFKFILVFLATKAKLLLLGFTKMGTLLSMFASVAVYWTIYGWPFAVGLVLSIYVHEMGHVAAIRRRGMSASAPMFIPLFGAVVRLNQPVLDPIEDARIGLAGPIWGLGAAVAAFGVYFATGSAIFGAIAHVGAWINLFNLLPFGSLDGGRGLNALTVPQRTILLAVIGTSWIVVPDGMLLLVGIGVVARMFFGEKPKISDRRTLIEFSTLVVALAAVIHFTSQVAHAR